MTSQLNALHCSLQVGCTQKTVEVEVEGVDETQLAELHQGQSLVVRSAAQRTGDWIYLAFLCTAFAGLIHLFTNLFN